MIVPPTTEDVRKVLEQFRQLGTVHEVKAKGAEEDEAELRAHQAEVKRRSRAKNGRRGW